MGDMLRRSLMLANDNRERNVCQEEQLAQLAIQPFWHSTTRKNNGFNSLAAGIILPRPGRKSLSLC